MRAHVFISRQQISIIPCKKYHKVITRALMSKSYQTLCVCKHFNIKTLKTQWFFNKNFTNFLSARSCGNHTKTIGFLRILPNPTISCHRAVHPRYSCHAPRARIPCKKYHAGHMRAPPRARMTSLTDLLNFCARGLPHRPCHHHRDHLPHRQMDISIVNVFVIIGAVIVCAVVAKCGAKGAKRSILAGGTTGTGCA